MNGLVSTAVAVALLMLTACVGAGKMWSEQGGVVLDEDTHQPIEGAIVVARWVGTISALVDSQTTCYHVEAATTDAQGHYQIPAWTKLPGKVHHDTVSYIVYKAGYRYVRGDRSIGAQYMRKDPNPANERLVYLQRLPGILSCGSEEDAHKLEKVLDDIYSEATEICGNGAVCDKKLLKSIHYQRDVVKYGWGAAQERQRRGEYE